MALLRRTALHSLHARLGSRFVDFAGWEMPVQYKSLLEEHRAVRSSAGLFDVSHMGEVVVSGETAERFLNRILTNDLGRLKVGRALYSFLCDPAGGVIDDLIVYRIESHRFLLCLNASNTVNDLEWMVAQAREWGFNGRIEDVSLQTSLLALQGPRAAELLASLAGDSLQTMKGFDVRQATILGHACTLARTGYTGEDGFEIFLPWDAAPEIAEALVQLGVPLCGLGARDSLRTEAGYPLYGHELSRSITPVQAGILWPLKFRKEGGFIGSDALERESLDGPSGRVVWFRTGDRRIPRPGTSVISADRVVGRVLSGTLSPMLNESIGSAWVERAALEASLAVDLRGAAIPLILVAPPLVSLREK